MKTQREHQQEIKSVVVGSDHAGFPLKESVIRYLKTKGLQVDDVGCLSTERADYPQIAATLVSVFKTRGFERGILCCGSGIGVAMAANRYEGIRAVVANDLHSAKWSRLHNDSNILCLGGRVVSPEMACEITDLWLSTPFEGGRHEHRVKLMDTLPSNTSATGEPSQPCSR